MDLKGKGMEWKSIHCYRDGVPFLAHSKLICIRDHTGPYGTIKDHTGPYVVNWIRYKGQRIRAKLSLTLKIKSCFHFFS